MTADLFLLDLIGIPHFLAGAMENWGLMTFNLQAYLYVSDRDSLKQKESVARTVVHELGHQVGSRLLVQSTKKVRKCSYNRKVVHPGQVWLKYKESGARRVHAL